MLGDSDSANPLKTARVASTDAHKRLLKFGEELPNF